MTIDLGKTVTVPIGADVSIVAGLTPDRVSNSVLSDYMIDEGRFFEQTGGRLASRGYGFPVTNASEIPIWDAFQEYGGVEAVGYPISQRFTYKGLTTQAFQKLVLQWQPAGSVVPVNLFDELHNVGKDEGLDRDRAVPPPFDTSPDSGLPWEQVMARHLAFLEPYPELQDAYFSADDPITRYGLPMSVKEYRIVVSFRCQRAVLQQWKVDTPWAQAGQVVVANGGDVAKLASLVPQDALRPAPPP